MCFRGVEEGGEEAVTVGLKGEGEGDKGFCGIWRLVLRRRGELDFEV